MRFVALLIIFVLLSGSINGKARQIIPEFLPDPSIELPLEGDELTALFRDRTHRGYYQYEEWIDREPAFTERMNADGTVVHNQDGVVSEGTWRARHNVVCFEYDDLFGGCFKIYKKGTCHFALSAYNNDVIAITVLDDEVADCEPSVA